MESKDSFIREVQLTLMEELIQTKPSFTIDTHASLRRDIDKYEHMFHQVILANF